MNIEMLDPLKANKMLGFYLEVDGNNNKQVEVMRMKAEEGGEK